MTRLPRVPAVLLAAIVATPALLLAPSAGAAPISITQQATWNFTQATIPGAQRLGAYGNGVTVAVVDTGVDGSLPDFGGRVLPGVDCSSGICASGTTGAPDPGQCDGYWHGTHVAGTIASSTLGVAPLARILPIRALGSSGSDGGCTGGSSGIAAGIRYAADHGAQVINLSLGDIKDLVGSLGSIFDPNGGAPADQVDAVAYAASKGSVVVFAAGNDNATQTENYHGNAVLVAASGPGGGLASYSNDGGTTAIAAPGGDCTNAVTKDCGILSTVPTGFVPTGYALAEGTSMAAPHVSGVAALLFAENPGISRTAVIDALQNTARPLAGAGHGLLDATAALSLHPNPSLKIPEAPSSAQPAPVGGSTKVTLSCAATVKAKKNTRAKVTCRRYPGQAGKIVKLQLRTSKGWTTVSSTRTAKDGTFTLYTKAVRGPQTLRVVSGTVTRPLRAAVGTPAKAPSTTF